MRDFVSVRNLGKRFGQVVALDDASLDVEEGELLALLGPSGCGKTTLLRLIGGLEVPTTGSVSVAGRVLNDATTFVPPEKRKVVMVFQDFALFPHMNVAKNIAFGLEKGANRTSRVDELLEMVGLPGLGNRMPHELSGGQQQRVALARALAPQPRLILLDEPFSNLDPAIRGRVRAEVRALMQRIGITAIFVTHDQDEALSVADRVAVMMSGHILQVGTPKELYQCPATRDVAEFFGDTNVLPGVVRAGVASCVLGEFPVAGKSEGPADILVRSEDIELADAGIEATVTALTYYGHQQMVTLSLADDTSIRARWRPGLVVSVGQQVRIRAGGNVHAFPRG